MFVKFPSIEGLHNVIRNAEFITNRYGPVIKYRGKVKLHGTNAAVRINADGSVYAQKRSGTITLDNDNAGFAAWVHENYEYFSKDAEDNDIVIYGEWAGKGIQKGVAVGELDRKFFPFAAYVIDHNFMQVDTGNMEFDHPDIFPLPWETDIIEIDFSKLDKLRDTVEKINERIELIEKVDPFILRTFGIEGTGEGLVFVPIMDDLTREAYSTLSFKAKGENHRVVKQKTAVQIDPTVAANIEQFADMFVTEARLNQGLTEIGGVAIPENIGPFLKWMGNDIQKESVAELEASNLEWKDVAKTVNNRALIWFKSKINEV